IMRIADKINYKVLNDSAINIDTSDTFLKPYWEIHQQDFMSEVSYEVKYIKQEKVSKSYDDAKISEYYSDNKTHFKGKDGKILPQESAKEAVIAELDAKATKDSALRTYIAYKKGKLTDDVKLSNATISASSNPYNKEILDKISKLTLASPFLKPLALKGEYFTFELIKVNPSKAKTYKEAKEAILPLYVKEMKKSKLIELAESSVATFSGKTTDFITNSDAVKLTNMYVMDANQFLMKLFNQTHKRGFITLDNGSIVLFNILEQKLLKKDNSKKDDSIIKIKSAMFNEGLIKSLRNKYKTEIFIEGL
ncbi:MAG: peptidyl-prolyl cis-trans isomerase, partial [Sulfurimonas sp.]|nr:peptidyl-prolyl cis-trans isomerase [Sulfurimonas sp.]